MIESKSFSSNIQHASLAEASQDATNNCEHHYISKELIQQLEGIKLVTNFQIPVHARSLAIRLILHGAATEVGCNISLDKLAEMEGTCKSTVRRMRDLLVGLNIFKAEVHNDRPWVLFFNSDGEDWIEYTTPEPKLRVLRGKDLKDSRDVADTPQDEEIGLVGKALSESQESNVSVVPTPTNPTLEFRDGWRGEGSSKHFQLGPIYDLEVGKEIQHQVEAEGISNQQVVVRAIKLIKLPKFTITLAAIAAEICTKVAAAISKLEAKKAVPDKEVPKRQWEDNQLEQWWEENKESFGEYKTYNQLSVMNGEKYITVDGIPQTISALRENSKVVKLRA